MWNSLSHGCLVSEILERTSATVFKLCSVIFRARNICFYKPKILLHKDTSHLSLLSLLQSHSYCPYTSAPPARKISNCKENLQGFLWKSSKKNKNPGKEACWEYWDLRTRQSAREGNFNPIIRMAPPEPITCQPSEGLLQRMKGSRGIEGYRQAVGGWKWRDLLRRGQGPRIEQSLELCGSLAAPSIPTAGMPQPMGDSTQGLPVFEEGEKGS